MLIETRRRNQRGIGAEREVWGPLAMTAFGAKQKFSLRHCSGNSAIAQCSSFV
jgi:hypothetical protein